MSALRDKQKPRPGSHTQNHDRWQFTTESVPRTTTTEKATTTTTTVISTTTTSTTTESSVKTTEKFDWRKWLANRSKLSTATASSTTSSPALKYDGNRLESKSTGRLLNGFYVCPSFRNLEKCLIVLVSWLAEFNFTFLFVFSCRFAVIQKPKCNFDQE